MDTLQLTHVPMMQTGMLIRKPAAQVFEAFVNPDITTHFWFTKSSGRLEAGSQVEWAWEMYEVSAAVTVKAIEPNTRIVIEWPGYSGLTTVEWLFAPQADGTTFVTITESGFTGDGDALVKQVADSTQGFSLVLAGLKALLEHNIRLNLVTDRYPQGNRSPLKGEDMSVQENVAQVRAVIEAWARAIRNHDMDGILAAHTDAIVMFDVPLQATGLDAYAKTWELFFTFQDKAAFDLHELQITASDTVAFCHSIVTCGTLDPQSQFQVRLTVGLQKIDGRWIITHEHHSAPAEEESS